MTIEPIGDIADVSMTEAAPETVTWETAADWDSAVSESGVAHESVTNTDHDDDSVVKMGYSYSGSPFASLVAWWPQHEDAGQINDLSGNGHHSQSITGTTPGVTSILGSTGRDYDGTDDIAEFGQPSGLTPSDFGATATITCVTWVNFDTFSGTNPVGVMLGGANANDVFRGLNLNGGGSGISMYVDNGDGGVFSSLGTSDFATDTWVMTAARYDGSTADMIGYNDQGTKITNAESYAGNDLSSTNGSWTIGGRANSSGKHFDGTFGDVMVFNDALTDTELDTLHGVVRSESSLTTASKSFSGAVQPDLQNLDYALNGESINLDVIGSPGTASEEVVTQTLDGATSYTLSWGSGHTNFRLKPRLSTADPTTTPTFSRGELVG